MVEEASGVGIDVNSRLGDLVKDLRVPSDNVAIANAPSPGSPDLGLTAGDVIHAVNGKAIRSLGELRSALRGIKPDGAVVPQVECSGRMIYLAFRAS